MSEQIVIKKPFDSHVHLRQGAMLKAVAPITAQKFAGGLIMPNADPPIETVAQAAEYKKEILDVINHSSILQKTAIEFQPLMSLYLTKNLSAEEIHNGASEGTVHAVKYYPWGYSINSQWGPRNVTDASEVLHAMEAAGVPLLLHSEVHLNEHNEEEDPYEGEKLFFRDTLPRLLTEYPNLKISLEHISTHEAAEFVEKNGKAGQLVATITPHHLMYDRTDAFRGGYRSLLNCKPLIKTKEDRKALRTLVAKGLPFISAGTDSAPHPESKKFSSCCVFGAFNAPIAVEMYTQVFDEMNALDSLEGFLSLNGPKFFGIEPSSEQITLVKKDWQLTEPVVTSEGVNVWPIGHVEHGLGNETFHWQIQ
jgi:dihydroorotase